MKTVLSMVNFFVKSEYILSQERLQLHEFGTSYGGTDVIKFIWLGKDDLFLTIAYK